MNKTQFYFILALLFALIVTVFATQNPEAITINFLLWQSKEISKVFVILASATIGALVVIFLVAWRQFRKFIYIRQLEREVKELRGKLTDLSSIEKMESEEKVQTKEEGNPSS